MSDFPGAWTYDSENRQYYYWSSLDSIFKYADGTQTNRIPRGYVQPVQQAPYVMTQQTRCQPPDIIADIKNLGRNPQTFPDRVILQPRRTRDI
jgi:hypothetical protein